MIRQRKEGSNYASWFIGFDHDEAFGLSPFSELPKQSTSTPVSNKPSLRATSLESLTPTSPSSKTPHPRSVTPVGTQTHAPRITAQPIATQTSLEVGESAAQTSDDTNVHFVSTGTETTELDRDAPTSSVPEVGVETSPDLVSQVEENHREFPVENGEHYPNANHTSSSHSPSQNSLLTTEPRSKRLSSDTSDPVRLRPRTNSGGGARPRSDNFDSLRNQRRRDKETKGLYREAFDGAKRAEEFKFRVKFDQFLGDLHGTLNERSPHGLPASFASPSYGEVMLLFRDKVKDLLKGFTHRLQLAHESFGNVESPEETAQKVKVDVSRFIEDLIGETLDLTSDEAVSDLSSLSDEASPDQQPTFEDLLAQAVVTKLLENHRKAVRDSLEPGNDNDCVNHYNNNIPSNNTNNYSNNHHSFDYTDRGRSDQTGYNQSQYSRPDLSLGKQDYNRVRNFISLDQDFVYGVDNRDFQSSDGGSRDIRESSGDIVGNSNQTRHPRDAFGGNRQVSVTSLRADSSFHGDGGGLYSRTLSNQNILNSSAEQEHLLVPQSHFSSEEDEQGVEERDSETVEDRSSNRSTNLKNNSKQVKKSGKQLSTSSTSSLEPEDQHILITTEREGTEDTEDASERESIADPEKDFLELKDFVRRTQEQARNKVEEKHLEEVAEQVEVQEEQLLQTSVDRDEEREQFHTRYSVFDRVYNAEPVLPDFSQFENIDFTSNEIDPDLLSMNLAIIPEETEEELEQEEEDEGEDGEGGHGKWRKNWIFKGKGVSPYDNLGKKKVGRLDQDGPVYMMVPRPEDDFLPKVGNRDIDQLSDFSEGDLLTRSDLDNTDDDEEEDDDDDDEHSFYADTSKELARIAGRRLRAGRKRRGSRGRKSDIFVSGLQENSTDYDNHPEQLVEDVPGPIVQPVKPEVKLLYDLIPAEGDDPRFLIPPESVTVQEGEQAQFTCRVTGTQPFDVFWYREGEEVEELEEGEEVEMGNSGDKYWCTVHHVGRKQAGQYMCIALSDKGKAIQYLVVTVKDNKQELKKPEFLKGLKDVEVTEGESVKFRVKVKGYPQPRVTWFKDGQLLKPSRACRIEKFGNRDYILTIDYATMDDDAEYTVSARNVAGTERLSAQVIVEPRSELPPRRQLISSVTTSAASDSDSDISGIYKRRSYNVANNKLSSSTPTSSPLLLSARRALSSSPNNLQAEHQLDECLSPPGQMSQAGDTSVSKAASDLIDVLPLSLTADPSPRTAMQERENELNLNHLDRRVTLTQRRVEEEAEKMEQDAQKAGIPLRNDDAVQRSPTVSKDVLAAAEEILKLETADPSLSALPDSGKRGVSSEEIDHTGPSIELDLPDELEDFPLPTVAKAKAAPVTSTFSMSVGGKDGDTENINNNNNVKSLVDEDTASWEGQTKLSEREKFKSEVSFPQNIRSSSSGSNILSASPIHRHHTATTNINNISFDSGQGGSLAGGENSASLASSVSSSTSSLGGGTGETDDGQVLSPSRVKGRYARDFDVGLHPQQQQQQQQQKKKWSVTLDPFSPQAEIVNKTPEVEIQVTDVSSSSVPSSPSQTSTPPSRPPPKERPLPVHMIGTTSEAEVPESRTEFNTDGNVELPSVNRLKALFSSQKDDMLGDGNFKRVAKHGDVHSITARSVSKQQLEKLKTSNQPTLSSLPPSIASSMSSSDFASRSPLSISQTATPSNQKLSSTSLKLNLSSSSSSSPSMQTDKSDNNASMVSLRHVPTLQKQQQPEKEQRRRSLIEDGSYLEVDDGKDPVLIYPERDPEYWKRQHKLFLHERQQQQQQQSQKVQKEEEINLSNQQLSAAESISQAPSSPQSSSSSSPLSPVLKTSGTSPCQTKSPRPSQPRLIVRRATSDINLDALESDGSGGGGVVGSPSGAVGGTRIKAGCISARAAFWEKRMMEGGETVAEDEFPEMVEEPDS